MQEIAGYMQAIWQAICANGPSQAKQTTVKKEHKKNEY